MTLFYLFIKSEPYLYGFQVLVNFIGYTLFIAFIVCSYSILEDIFKAYIFFSFDIVKSPWTPVRYLKHATQ